MIFAYLDESGNTGTKADPNQPIHLIGCLLVKDEKIRPLEDAISNITDKHFSSLKNQDGFEWHGAEIYSGSGLFKKIPVQSRINAILDLVQTVEAYVEGFGYTGVNKIKTVARDHPHCIAFSLLVERLEPYLKNRNQLGLIVADENQEIGQRLIDDMQFFKEYSTFFGYKSVKIVNIVDSIHFVQSHNNRIIQACDVITYFFLKGHRIQQGRLQEYIAAAAPKPNFPEWLKATVKPAEFASYQIYTAIGKITRFAGKIFNE